MILSLPQWRGADNFESAPCRRCDAFSLIEILAVLAILVLLTAALASLGPGLIRANNMSGAINEVSAGLSLARSEAVRSRQTTYFVMGPIDPPFDDRSFRSYAIVARRTFHGEEFRYVAPWRQLPPGILFDSPDETGEPSQQAGIITLPYPTENSPTRDLPAVAFLSDGSIDDYLHSPPLSPRITLRTGAPANDFSPAYQGLDRSNQLKVQRLSGRVEVDREN